jgi:hypothetical protein
MVGRLKAQPEAEVSGRTGLEQLYRALTPEERVTAILRASARGDEAERARLVWAAPRQTFSVPDCHGLQEGLIMLSLSHLATLTSWAALYWEATAARDQGGTCASAEARLARIAHRASGHAEAILREDPGAAL